MRKPQPLRISQLYKACRASDFKFTSSQQLEPLQNFLGHESLGQQRVIDALEFATSIEHKSYNIFAVGEKGLGKRTLVRRFLQQRAQELPTPDDWLYVHDFENPRQPWALNLPAGLGKVFKQDLQEFILDLKQAIPAAFDNEGFFERAEKIKDTAADSQHKALNKLAKAGEKQQLKLVLQSPGGYMFVPATAEGEPMEASAYAELSEAEQENLQLAVDSLEKELRQLLRELTQIEKASRLELQALNEEVTNEVLASGLENLQQKYASFSKVQKYLSALHRDLLDNLGIFLTSDEEEIDAIASVSPDKRLPTRYQVNLLSCSEKFGCQTAQGAPVIEEALPTHNNLVGHIETVTYQGTVATDFSLIRPGALHAANGGFLILDAERLLTQPYAWEGLKLALRTGCLRIDTLEKQLSVSGSVSLEPEPIPLNCTVVLLGDYAVLNALYEQDSEFDELFKIVAEFSTEMPRTPENQLLYARLIASLVKSEKLLPLHKKALMRLIEQAALRAEHQDKIDLNATELSYLLREASFQAQKRIQAQNSSSNASSDASSKTSASSKTKTAQLIELEDLEAALAARRKRAGRFPEEMLEAIAEDFIMLSTQGEQVGQVNALTLVGGHDAYHGQPSRITARVHYGSGEVLDIERNVHLGGAMHSKGVLILNSFLTGLFAQEDDLPLDASLVFEQSYAQVDGDSASLAELVCLLSAMAEVPAKQELAITGSVNQLGQVQPIGGVNEKIEGFFQVCKLQGLNGKQGVIIPRQNVRQLMLAPEILAAVKERQFHVWAVSQVEEAVLLLLGQPAEKIYAKISARLDKLREKDAPDSPNKEDAG